MEHLHVAMVQTALVWEDPKANRDLLASKMEQLEGEVDLIILPEMFTTGFTMDPGSIPADEGQRTLDWMQEQAKKYRAGILGSTVFIGENNRHFNRLFFVGPDGEQEQYDKRHTFTLAGEDKEYEAGKKRLLFEFRGFRICPMICYDLRFPVWSRNTEDYDLLIYVANWPAPRIGAWDALLKARAIENMSYCLGVNRLGSDQNGHEYTGHSAAYDCLGNTIVFSQEEAILQVVLSQQHLNLNREKLQFLKDRDHFNIQR
ncbi:amidohydrolase [Lentiprolixibacter aurantiacus]|uniref:Omega-amidase YafV n=1 Tax=Lentiprolixibacter aurantiacus TaxID=2993939 RepID=A0AAE3MJE2_9FLAO|nr:amidohydrolase [Lentiprolixibacter aurantiacus]MCX2718313.1 amidohydrolase [Lentiprolixibacter aurantiacus]